MLDRLFGLKARGVTVGGEVLGGLTTFMVMAYIIFVNPAILSFSGIQGLEGKGPAFAPTLAVTCLVAGLATIAMGVVANYPLAVASGMGLNAVVAFQLVAGMKLPWSAAMGVVFLEGVAITILVLTGFRSPAARRAPARHCPHHASGHRRELRFRGESVPRSGPGGPSREDRGRP